MSHWEVNTDGQMLESWRELLESSIYPLEKYTYIHCQSKHHISWFPYRPPSLTEFDACSESTSHFCLLALCCIPLLLEIFCSRTSQLQERRDKPPLLAPAFLLRFSSNLLSFPHQHSWAHQFLWGDWHPQVQPVWGMSEVRILFWCISHLEKC